MPIDTNPFANGNQQYQTPSYLQQQPNNPTMAGNVANMVKAIMDGNNQYMQRQKQIQGNAPLQKPAGSPMDITTPAQQASMSPVAQPVTPQGMQGGVPTQPMAPDMFSPSAMSQFNPVTSALFSPIPGVPNTGSPY